MKLRRALLAWISLAALIGLVPLGAVRAAETTAPAARLVLKGHDPVAYFTAGKPLKGSENFKYVWDGGLYLFANQKNRERFMSSPERYAPQFSGFCTSGLSMGEKVEADPTQWKIVDGRLYVFSGPAFRKDDPAKLASQIASAEKNWPKVK